ncbi:Uncharacterised protein [Kluyvera cryocrescens]|uniref:Uncharacterized protein n=1 Tax=Kluyvera cryocrescens TaxID=580 RepID=A0A485A2R8_KLUCR|nr:Uncharacterised protein [Kluyvera cryocrescens]
MRVWYGLTATNASMFYNSAPERLFFGGLGERQSPTDVKYSLAELFRHLSSFFDTQSLSKL